MRKLRPRITLLQGTAMAVSMVMGSGVLGLPGLVLDQSGPKGALLAWLTVTLLIIPLVWVFARLGIRFASAAGLARYAAAAFGPWAATAVTLVLLGTFTLGIPAMAAMGAAYLQRSLGLPTAWSPAVAAGLLSLATLLNLGGPELTGRLSQAAVAALVGLTALLGVTHLPDMALGVQTLQALPRHLPSWAAAWRGAALLFWAFLGWESLSFALEEFREPARNIPRVYALSFGLVAALYLILALTAVGADQRGVHAGGPAGLAALAGAGPASRALAGGMALLIAANTAAWVFAAARLAFAAARDGILPARLARLDAAAMPRPALLALLVVYLGVMGVTAGLGIPLSSLILLVSQNFLVLYLGVVPAFWKLDTSRLRLPLSLAAGLAVAVMLPGFSWRLIYPAALILIGRGLYARLPAGRRQKARGMPLSSG